jgi:hypothetical protein
VALLPAAAAEVRRWPAEGERIQLSLTGIAAADGAERYKA